MKKLIFLVLFLLTFLPLMGVEAAPRISDREIVERLVRLEEKQISLEKRIDSLEVNMNKRIDDLRSEMIARFEAVDKRFEAVDKRFDSMEKRFDILQWMFGIFISLSIVILGFTLRMQWQLQKRVVSVEKSIETQKDEISFLKNLIEKLITQRTS